MSLMCVRLEQVPNPGDVGKVRIDAYEFTIPLDSEDRLDLENWDAAAPYCTTCRYLRDGTVQHGLLTRTGRGEWAFKYDSAEFGEDYIYRFLSHSFRPGEELSITQSDGTDRFYRIASVTHPLVFDT